MRDLAVHESGEVIDLAEPTAAHKELLKLMLAEREQIGRTRKGVLVCASHGAPMYLRWRGNVLYACHWPGAGPGMHAVALMSVEHKMQAQYVARAADRAGLSTAFEATLPTHVRPDLVIGGDTAVEVQRSHLTVQAARSRTTKAIKGGMALSLWLSDKQPDVAPRWMYRVPSATAFAREWHTMPPLGSATVTSGARVLVEQPCRPPYRTQCPERRGRWCGKTHLFHEPMRGTSLDDLAVWMATGELVPAALRGQILLAAAGDVERYGVAWTPPAAAGGARAEAAGRDRYECQAPSSATASSTVQQPRPEIPALRRDGGARVITASARTLAPTLDWRAARHWGGGKKLPCRYCGNGALLRDEVGDPAHKVCAETALDAAGRLHAA